MSLRRAGLLALAGLALAPAGASACSVAESTSPDPDRERFDASRIAITARVTAVRPLDPAPAPGEPPVADRRYEATLRVSRVYKGKTGPALRVRSREDGGLCGFGTLRVGQRLGLLLRGPGSPFAIDILSGISSRDLERITRGHAWRPGTR